MSDSNPGPDPSEIFSNARALPLSERPAYLDRACGGDAELRAEVDSLLLALPAAEELFRDPMILAHAHDALRLDEGMAEGHQVGCYRILRMIATGGMASVYLADDLKHHRKVALKVMQPEIAAAIGHERFLREIDIAAQLTHPHILPLHDSGADGGRLYYVMPHIEEDSLRARLARDRRLPLGESLRLAHQVASALGHAHSQGIVHRDVKPENILLSHGFALVADFGIARIAQSSRAETAAATQVSGAGATRFGVVLGTPLYMAPEQSSAQGNVDGRADQYSLGCVLYEMLAGQPPFPGTDPAELMARHARASVPPLGVARPDVPHRIIGAVERALSKGAADRYPTMAAFAEALATAGAGSYTPTARPEPEWNSVPNNLTRQRTRFIGRDRELAECTRLLAEARLLTLTGTGGSGKTRMALRLAETHLGIYRDGAWFVDLAPLSDPLRVPLAVAAALDVREEPGTPLVDRLARHLGDSCTLLVLDNCEHVLAAAAELCETLLAKCPGLRILVTSREGLGIHGERPVALGPLSLPAPEAGELSLIEASEAVRLFVDRAQLVDLDFVLDATTSGAVAEICRRLDGIPLAVELAAARISVLSAQEIRSKLDDRFRLLTAGGRAALPRQQTLLAAIQWSYDLLEPRDQRMFRLLSVFAGGWTLAGAAAVAGEGPDEFVALDAISRLVNKSMVVMSRDDGGGSRYSMLETVGQYARDRLAELGEANASRSRHLAFHVALASEAELGLRGAEQGAWLSRLERERENLLLAHSWCDSAEDGGESGLRLAVGLQSYWLLRGRLAMGHGLGIEALNRPGAQERTLLRCRALVAAGQFSSSMGNRERARLELGEALPIARELGDKAALADALRVLGVIAENQGDVSVARTCFEESLAVARDHGDPVALARALNTMGESCRAEGDLDAAEAYYSESISIFRRLESPDNTSIGLTNLSMLFVARGASGRAREMLLEAQSISRQIGSKRAGQSVLDVSVGFWTLQGDWGRAARLFGALEAHRELIGMRRDRADDMFLMAHVSRSREAMGQAAFAVAEAGGRVLTYEEALDMAGTWLAGG